MLSFSSTMSSALLSATTKSAWCQGVIDFLGASRRLICKRSGSAGDVWAIGTTFFESGLTGTMAIVENQITNLGALADVTVQDAVDLATGFAVVRITDSTGVNWIQGTLGLTGSGADFILAENINTVDGVGLSASALIGAPSRLSDAPPTDLIIATVTATNTTGSGITDVPMTFGHPFKAGDWNPVTHSLRARVGGVSVPCQANEVSTHTDGTARLAVVSVQVPAIAGSANAEIELYAGIKNNPAGNIPADPDWNMTVELDIYSGETLVQTVIASPQAALVAAIDDEDPRRLDGPVAVEYLIVSDFLDSITSTPHPHLTARFNVRMYKGAALMYTDVTIENTRTFVASPGNIDYAARFKRNGSTLHTQARFTHNHHARWHRQFWAGGTKPPVRIQHQKDYFLDSKITWNYDRNLVITEGSLAAAASGLAAANTNLMQKGLIRDYFPATGATDGQVGPLFKHTALYLLSLDDRARACMLSLSDSAAGCPAHFRDENTGQPLDVITWPSVAVRFGTSTPSLPAVSPSTTVFTVDQDHQGSFAYIQYVITGDEFYLDETMFWASWNIASQNPGSGTSYRGRANGWLVGGTVQNRGRAWSMRSLGEAFFACPDGHPLKPYFATMIANNVPRFNDTYNASVYSPLGAIEKSDEFGVCKPWQVDFLGVVFAWLAENGISGAQTFAEYLNLFCSGRFINAPDFCPQRGPTADMDFCRDGGSAFWTNWEDFYAANNAAYVGTACELIEWDGYPDIAAGYAATSRGTTGALAAVDPTMAEAAFAIIEGGTPEIEDDMVVNPQWAIVPRT